MHSFHSATSATMQQHESVITVLQNAVCSKQITRLLWTREYRSSAVAFLEMLLTSVGDRFCAVDALMVMFGQWS